MALVNKTISRVKGLIVSRSLISRRIRIEGRIPKISGSGHIEIGSGVTIRNRTKNTRLSTDLNGKIVFGSEVFLNESCRIHSSVLIDIGSYCKIGEDVQIFDTSFHPVGNSKDIESAPVIIENNVWIANNVVILPGVVIGHDSVVGIGSIVTKSFPPYSLVAGNPAVWKRDLS